MRVDTKARAVLPHLENIVVLDLLNIILDNAVDEGKERREDKPSTHVLVAQARRYFVPELAYD